MLRFPNPGSDISSFIRIFIEMYSALQGRASFGLDDITQVLIERNLATSCGYMGAEALRRSTRQDRSLDPLYNQSKMYSELYKVLGWLHPTAESALTFKFTLLGAHVIEAKHDPFSLFKECLLGIIYPNPILNVSSDQELRPFVTILRTMAALDTIICRDEMIIGPLCLKSDRSQENFSKMLEQLRTVRGKRKELAKQIAMVSAKRGIKKTTMENYTRFPIAALKWSGWTRNERRKDVYGISIPFLHLTEDGQKTLQLVQTAEDLREADLKNLKEETKAAIVKISFYKMLERSGFDLSPIKTALTKSEKEIPPTFKKSGILLFSPFQSLSPDYVESTLPLKPSLQYSQEDFHGKLTKILVREKSVHYTAEIKLSPSSSEISHAEAAIIKSLRIEFGKTKDIQKTITRIKNNLKTSNKETFYPLVADLFRALNYDCQYSRVGVNYQRWDAFIIDSTESIPIEIKSPGEEEFISVKAIRQALENKIILLSRKPFPTKHDTTSLAVCFNLPNDRADVSSLIMDIHKAYKINVGVIDIAALLYLFASKVLKGKTHDRRKMATLRGVIDVSNS